MRLLLDEDQIFTLEKIADDLLYLCLNFEMVILKQEQLFCILLWITSVNQD